MFVKKSWSTYKGKRSVQYHLAQAYRDPRTRKPRHRLLANLTPLPPHVIDAVREGLRTGKPLVGISSVQVRTGDAVRGAGLLAVYRAWRQEGMPEVLQDLTPAEQASTLAMAAQRILEPGSKLSLQEQFRNTLLAKAFSRKRLDEDELYRVMDVLHEHFYTIQQRLRAQRQAAPVLCLYDITSTYFEGRGADEGAYGYSRDKRWDRYQIVIGLVCDEEGVPLSIEVWPGNTADRSTVIDRIQALKEQFGIEYAVFVGDGGMYSEANIEKLQECGFDYILRTEWHTQRQQLEGLAPTQLELFNEQGVVEWVKDGVRYVGCLSEFKRLRAANRREQGMETARQKLEQLAQTAAKGRYCSWTRLRERVNDILAAAGVKGLWQVEIAFEEGETGSPEDRRRLRLRFVPDEEAIKRREGLEGAYVLRTSLDSQTHPADRIDEHYRRLQYAERAFRHIKSYLKLRPVHHYRRRRVRAHVLICFLAFYLVKAMEKQLRTAGETREVELLLRRWDQLQIVQQQVTIGEHNHEEWQWSLGEIGQDIRTELETIGWWKSIDADRRSLTKKPV